MLFCFRQRIEFFTARTTSKLFILDVFALRYTWIIFHINLRGQEIRNGYATVETDPAPVLALEWLLRLVIGRFMM
jgi:hypothetical protein